VVGANRQFRYTPLCDDVAPGPADVATDSP